MSKIFESAVEAAAIEWFQELGYTYVFGPDLISADGDGERAGPKQVVLTDRLLQALKRINPGLPPIAIKKAAANHVEGER